MVLSFTLQKLNGSWDESSWIAILWIATITSQKGKICQGSPFVFKSIVKSTCATRNSEGCFPLSKAELMEKIANKARVCVKCPLWKGRRNTVPGEGDVDASVVFVGEAPGYWEDVKGLPFVGAAGKVLDAFLKGIKLPREKVFITNVVKCRPPENRDPQPNEIKTCTSLYLNNQIKLIQPKIIVTLGRHSTAYMLSKAGFKTEATEGITQLRGKVYKTRFLDLRVSMIPMFHPAAVLHNPKYREALESDFQLLKNELKKHEYA